MFINSITLSNFKGFIGDDHKINFKTPDGITAGSGLNILIGENNSGKSSVFEAISFLRNGIKNENVSLIKSKLADGSQPNEASVEIIFTGKIAETISCFVQNNKRAVFNNAISNKTEFKAQRNTIDYKNVLLWNNNNQNYENATGIDAPFKKMFEANFIWADTNPNDEASFGSTTLCGMLLKEIAQAHINSDEYKEFQEGFNKVFNNPDSLLRKQIATIEKKVQKLFIEQFGQAEIRFNFDELKIDSFFKNASIFINDGVDIPMSEKGNGMQRSVALALLQVYAEELARDVEKNQTKPFYLFIDEPEICLHPKGQTKLLSALLEISKTKQVFLTTHSPYFLTTPHLKNVGLFIFRKDGVNNIVEDASMEPMFPWSPTWGEINFRAYKLPTVELHNELYGQLQQNSKQFNEKGFDQWLNGKGIHNIKKWTREKGGIAQPPNDVTLQTFIRNHIHHPENKTMQSSPYTQEELQRSIEEMIRLL